MVSLYRAVGKKMVPQLHVIPGTDPVFGDQLLWDSDIMQSVASVHVSTLAGSMQPFLRTDLLASQHGLGGILFKCH